MTGIAKHFGAVKALTEVDFWVDEGEVVALVGDNGAGKSTLVKILAGVHPPDAGTIDFGGVAVDIGDPADAQDLGIATVFQDLALCDNLDVVANLWLGRELTVDGRLDEVDMEQRTWALMRELAAKIPSVRVPVAALSGGQRQTVAIARSLIGDPRVVILDEPTAALGVAQTAEVLNLIERLRERGHGVVLISHNMADVLAVADRIVVLRLGRNNGVYNAADVTTELLIAAITGAVDSSGRRIGAPGAAAAPGTAPGTAGSAPGSVAGAAAGAAPGAAGGAAPGAGARSATPSATPSASPSAPPPEPPPDSGVIPLRPRRPRGGGHR